MHTSANVSHPQPHSRSTSYLILVAITLSYVSLGTILGFVQGGVAPVLREQGVPLSAMRWVYALYLPFGISFFWAPLVDSWHWPWFGHRTGWIMLSCLPIITLIAHERRLSSSHLPRKRANFIRLLSKPNMATRFIRLTLLVCTLLALFSFNRLLLIDMGMPLAKVGSILGIIAPLANATACVLALYWVRLIGVQRALWLTITTCLVSVGLISIGIYQADTTMVVIGSIFTTAGAAALYVVLGSLMLEWASGQQAATDYALLYGVGRFIGILALIILPGIIPVVGWSTFQLSVILGFACAAWYFVRLHRIPGCASLEKLS